MNIRNQKNNLIDMENTDYFIWLKLYLLQLWHFSFSIYWASFTIRMPNIPLCITSQFLLLLITAINILWKKCLTAETPPHKSRNQI